MLDRYACSINKQLNLADESHHSAEFSKHRKWISISGRIIILRHILYQ